jgi:GTPase involved in cell partitioning and DNA repair
MKKRYCSRQHPLQDTSKPAKGKRGNKKGERGKEATIVIVFFQITTIVREESSQKLIKSAKHFRQDVAFT